MALTIYRGANGRYRSDFYTSEDEKSYSVAERTLHGVLVSEFNEDGELLDQIYKKSNEPLREVADYLKGKTDRIEVINVESCGSVRANAACDDCNQMDIVREFDLLDTKKIADVPVVPIFVCVNCKKRFYSVNKKYIKKLALRNPNLFAQEELGMKERDENAFIDEIQEYMIRIFASKKLARLKINK